ncbi:unnamed protein product [Meganyctiphanes norvegica]|uniref:Uncharacterized protein n=1 Tax=Meganyctiphanes norvegica TaxID=48144 RepID=A0AAV2QP99_MEGNR
MDFLNGSRESKLKTMESLYSVLAEDQYIPDPNKALKIVQSAYSGLGTSDSVISDVTYLRDDTKKSTSNQFYTDILEEMIWQQLQYLTLNYEENQNVNVNLFLNEPDEKLTNVDDVIDFHSKTLLLLEGSSDQKIDFTNESYIEPKISINNMDNLYSKRMDFPNTMSNLLSKEPYVLLEEIDKYFSFKASNCPKYAKKEPVLILENIEKNSFGIHSIKRGKKQMRNNIYKKKSLSLKNNGNIKKQRSECKKILNTKNSHKKVMNSSPKNNTDISKELKKIRNNTSSSLKRERKQMRNNNNRTKSQVLKKKVTKKKQVTSGKKNINKVSRCNKIKNLSPKSNKVLSKKIKKTVNKKSVSLKIKNKQISKNIIKTKSLSMKKKVNNKKPVRGVSVKTKNKQISKNISKTKSLSLKKKVNNKKPVGGVKRNLNKVIIHKKRKNISPKKKKDLSKKIKKKANNTAAPLKKKKKLMRNNNNRNKSLFLKKKLNNKKQETGCKKSKKEVISHKKRMKLTPKKTINLSNKLKKAVNKNKLKKTVNIYAVSLKKDKKQIRNNINGTKSQLAKHKGKIKKQETRKKKNINKVISRKKKKNLSPKKKKALSNKLKKTVNKKKLKEFVNTNATSLKREKKKIKNNINGTKSLSLKNKGNNKKQETSAIKDVSTVISQNKITSIFSNNNVDLSKKLKKTLNNGVSPKSDKRQIRNKINKPRKFKDGKEARVELVRLNESLIKSYCLSEVKKNTRKFEPLNQAMNEVEISKIRTKKRKYCSLYPKLTITGKVSNKNEKEIIDNDVITNEINDLSMLTSKDICKKFEIEKEARVNLVRLNESLITNDCLSEVNSTRNFDPLNQAKRDVEISKKRNNKRKFCSLYPKQSIYRRVSNKNEKKMVNNAVITNQMNDFSPLTVKDICKKFEIEKEARVQLVRLNERFITNDSLSEVTSNARKCDSLNKAKKEVEISKSRTNKIKYYSRPNQLTTRRFSNEKIDNSVVTNQINDFTPLTLKDLCRKKEARVQLVRLNEFLITKDCLSEVKNNPRRCVSLNHARKKVEILNKRTSKRKCCNLQPKKSAKSFSDEKENHVDTFKEHSIPNCNYKIGILEDSENSLNDQIENLVVSPHVVVASDTKIVHSKLQDDLKNRFHNIPVACKQPTMNKIPTTVIKRKRFDIQHRIIQEQSNQNNPPLIAPKFKEEKIIQNQGRNENHLKEIKVVLRRLEADLIKNPQSLLSNPKKINNCDNMNKTQGLLKRKNLRNYPAKSSMMCSILKNNTDFSNISNILSKKCYKKNKKACVLIKKNPVKDENCLREAFRTFCTSQLAYEIHNWKIK